MSWKASAFAKDIRTFADGTKLTASDKCVLMVLGEYTHHETEIAWPSVSTLARDCCMSVNACRAVLHRLEQGGVIAIVPRKKENGQSDSNKYLFKTPGWDSPKFGVPRTPKEHQGTLPLAGGGTPAGGSLTNKEPRIKEEPRKREPPTARFTSSDAERIYQAYPRHVAPEAAKRAILKALQTLDEENPVEALMQRVQEYASSPAGNRDGKTPHPATWFNRKSYLDDPREWDKV